MVVEYNSGKITQISTTQARAYEYVWVIKNFCILLSRGDQIGDYKQSPKFCTELDNYCEFSLQMYPFGYDDDSLGFVAIQLNPIKINEKNLLYVVEIKMTDTSNALLSKKSITFNPKTFNIRDLIIKEFAQCKDTGVSLPELRINCHISIIYDNDTSITDERTYSFHKFESGILGRVLDTDKYADFKLVVGEKEFNVHRAILAAQSPVFEAMFDTKMRESNEGQVDIVDVEAGVMEELLRFVYASKLKNIENIADKLLVAAEKYQLDALKQMCENVLVKKLNLMNVYDVLRLADENIAKNLKKEAMEFFHHNSKELAAQDKFRAQVDSLPGHLKTDIIVFSSIKSDV